MERSLRAVQSISRFMQLEQPERWFIVEACFYMICAKLATLAVPARTLLALGSIPTPIGRPSAQLPQEIREATDAIEQSSIYLGFTNCLIRAVALRMLLARRNIPTELHIGARKDEEGKFAAHAWLTYHDAILVGGDDATSLYRELVSRQDSLLS